MKKPVLIGFCVFGAESQRSELQTAFCGLALFYNNPSLHGIKKLKANYVKQST
ncbi:MAG: hypothetical protein AB7S72_18660 [Draconibacterium sp.]